MSSVPPPRILAIDGGGLKGVLPAAFLAHVEQATGKRVVDHFDLIAGTSTGGIIALGLGLGLSAREILDFYLNDGPKIFAQTNVASATFREIVAQSLKSAGRRVRHAFTTKYDSTSLRSALEHVFGDRKLGESATRLIIPAYNSASQRPYVFKTSHHPRLTTDYAWKVVDVAMATAAAPTYFEAHDFEGAIGLIDGGIWANNPSGMAAVEGAGMLGWDMRQARMLSLGCSEQFLTPSRRVGGLKALCGGWVTDILFRGQDRASMGTAKLLLGHPHENPCLIRVNPSLERRFRALDDASIISELQRVAIDCARHHMPQVQEFFFSAERPAFVPCRPVEGANGG